MYDTWSEIENIQKYTQYFMILKENWVYLRL